MPVGKRRKIMLQKKLADARARVAEQGALVRDAAPGGPSTASGASGSAVAVPPREGGGAAAEAPASGSAVAGLPRGGGGAAAEAPVSPFDVREADAVDAPRPKSLGFTLEVLQVLVASWADPREFEMVARRCTAGLVILHFARDVSAVADASQKAAEQRDAQLREILRGLPPKYSHAVPSVGAGALLWNTDFVHVQVLSEVPSDGGGVHAAVFYELRAVPQLLANRHASTVVASVVFRKTDSKKTELRPWSASFVTELRAKTMAMRPLWLSAVFDNPPEQIAEFCRSCGAHPIGLYLTWFQRALGRHREPAALPSGMVWFGPAKYNAPGLENLPREPERLQLMGPHGGHSYLRESVPFWYGDEIPRSVLPSVAHRPWGGKVTLKAPDLQWWRRGLHQLLVYIDGSGKLGGSQSRARKKGRAGAAQARRKGARKGRGNGRGEASRGCAVAGPVATPVAGDASEGTDTSADTGDAADAPAVAGARAEEPPRAEATRPRRKAEVEGGSAPVPPWRPAPKRMLRGGR